MRALSAKYPLIQLLKIDKATEESTAAKLRDVILLDKFFFHYNYKKNYFIMNQG
jgi:hypothetical protein